MQLENASEKILALTGLRTTSRLEAKILEAHALPFELAGPGGQVCCFFEIYQKIKNLLLEAKFLFYMFLFFIL